MPCWDEQIRDRLAQTLIFLLKVLQLPQLIRPHAAILLVPAIPRLFRDADLSDRMNARHTLAHECLYLAWLC